MPNGARYCVALMDHSIRVYYADTHRQVFSLYGHKLPVIDMDISSDGVLMASGG